MILSDILQLRNDITGNYIEFVEHFISSVVGETSFKNNQCDQLLSDFTAINDEAWAILIYENNAETGKGMVDKNITKNSKVTKKYTNAGSSNGLMACTHQYQRWSTNGIKRFNELFDIIKTDKSSEKL